MQRQILNFHLFSAFISGNFASWQFFFLIFTKILVFKKIWFFGKWTATLRYSKNSCFLLVPSPWMNPVNRHKKDDICYLQQISLSVYVVFTSNGSFSNSLWNWTFVRVKEDAALLYKSKKNIFIFTRDIIWQNIAKAKRQNWT